MRLTQLNECVSVGFSVIAKYIEPKPGAPSLIKRESRPDFVL